MASESVVLTDLEHMRAVVHPARWRVLEELHDGRTLTATQAAELTGLTPSAMSYHLAQLAKTGLIERDEATGDGRERPWRAVGNGFRMTQQPDAAVGTAMMRNIMASVSQLLGTPAPDDAQERPWPASYTHTRIRLTRDRARELFRRVNAVIEEFDEAQDADGVVHDLFWISGVRASPES